jgi:hypothetical protein
VDQVGQILGAGRLAQLLGRMASVWGGSTQTLVATRLHEEEMPESVETDPPGWPATT